MLLRLHLTVFGLFFGLQALAQECTPYVYRNNEIIGNSPKFQSFLFEVVVADTPPSYILGSFHSADVELLTRWGKVAILLASASPRLFISERDLQDTSAVQRQILPAEDNLKARLAGQAGLFERVLELLNASGLTKDAVQRLNPWFAAVLLNQAGAMPQRSSDKIIDQVLQETATALGIPTAELETFANIADLYENNFSQQEHSRLLWEAVCNQELLAGLIEAQTKAFAENDVAAFYQLLNRYTGADAVLNNKLSEVFVKRRNGIFWRQLWPEIQRGGVFIVVGNLHVFGAGGLLERLAVIDKGASVIALDPAALNVEIDQGLLKGLQSWALDWAHSAGIDNVAGEKFQEGAR